MKSWKNSVSSLISTPLLSNIRFRVCPQILCVLQSFQKCLEEEVLELFLKAEVTLFCFYKFLVVCSDGKTWLLLGLTSC